MDPGSEEGRKFAEELHWCITQLELGLQRQSPDSKQAAETIKVLKILRSTKAPMVKKRQAMRNALGDYRKKMKEAEKKSLSGLRHSKFQPCSNARPYGRSRFLRHSHSKQHQADQVRDELNRNMNNLYLEHSEGQYAAPELNASSSHATDGNSGPERVSNAYTGIPNCSKDVTGAHIFDNHQLNHHGSASTSASSSLPSSVSERLGKSHATEESSSDLPHSCDSKQGVHSFKFVPSDNSFCFDFENPVTDAGNSNSSNVEVQVASNVCVQDDIVESSSSSGLTFSENNNVKKNFYEFKKSDNEFCFNFGQMENS